MVFEDAVPPNSPFELPESSFHFRLLSVASVPLWCNSNYPSGDSRGHGDAEFLAPGLQGGEDAGIKFDAVLQLFLAAAQAGFAGQADAVGAGARWRGAAGGRESLRAAVGNFACAPPGRGW